MAEPDVVEQIEMELLRCHGVIRYANDANHRNWTRAVRTRPLCLCHSYKG